MVEQSRLLPSRAPLLLHHRPDVRAHLRKTLIEPFTPLTAKVLTNYQWRRTKSSRFSSKQAMAGGLAKSSMGLAKDGHRLRTWSKKLPNLRHRLHLPPLLRQSSTDTGPSHDQESKPNPTHLLHRQKDPQARRLHQRHGIVR